MNSNQGTYILVFHNATEFTVQVGKLCRATISTGYYGYVGSAFGPSGLKSRVNRHNKKNKVHRWHMDYIRDRIDLISVWYTVDPKEVECSWSNTLNALGGTCPVYGFGSSDCKCESHFFQFEDEPSFRSFRNNVSERLSREMFE